MKLTLLIALLALPLVVHAGPKEEAKTHIANATEAHQQGKYDVAINELYAAYNLDPQPDLLYAIGQVEVKRGHCIDAIRAYERFLATKPAAEPAAAAQEAIAACKAQTQPQQTQTQTPAESPAQPEASAKPPAPEPKPAPAPAPADTQAEGRPFYTDVIGSVLVGAGVVSAAAGGYFYKAALDNLDDADHATTYSAQQKLVDDAHTKRNIALACGGVAIAAIGVGVWHYTRYHEEQSHVAFAPVAHGGMLAWIGRF